MIPFRSFESKYCADSSRWESEPQLDLSIARETIPLAGSTSFFIRLIRARRSTQFGVLVRTGIETLVS